MNINNGLAMRAIKVATGKQLRVFLCIALLEKAKVNDISDITRISKEGVRRAVRELDKLLLIRVERDEIKIKVIYLKEDE